MSERLFISTAQLEDTPRLVKLVNSAYRGEGSKKGWTTEADLLDGIRTDEAAIQDMMKRKDAVILKCTNKEDDLLGCVFLEKLKEQLYLGMLTVSPELQGGGIGKQLLRASEAHAYSLGCHSIVMTVISIRSELIAWYERNGYHLTPETRPFPSDPRFGIPRRPLEFVVMEKKLNEKKQLE